MSSEGSDRENLCKRIFDMKNLQGKSRKTRTVFAVLPDEKRYNKVQRTLKRARVQTRKRPSAKKSEQSQV